MDANIHTGAIITINLGHRTSLCLKVIFITTKSVLDVIFSSELEAGFQPNEVARKTVLSQRLIAVQPSVLVLVSRS